MRDNRSLMSEALIDAILLEAEAVIYYSSKHEEWKLFLLYEILGIKLPDLRFF